MSGANLSRTVRSIAYALARASPPVRDGGVIREPSFAPQSARRARPPMLAEPMSAPLARQPLPLPSAETSAVNRP